MRRMTPKYIIKEGDRTINQGVEDFEIRNTVLNESER